jgi:pyridoxal 5'-phosphate synthase pdxS subunit
MALERVPADIRAQGGVARMSDPELILKIMDTVSIPVMAKARIGHFVEAQILEAIGIDYIDETEVLTPADEEHTSKNMLSRFHSFSAAAILENLSAVSERCSHDPHQGEAAPRRGMKRQHARRVLGRSANFRI